MLAFPSHVATFSVPTHAVARLLFDDLFRLRQAILNGESKVVINLPVARENWPQRDLGELPPDARLESAWFSQEWEVFWFVLGSASFTGPGHARHEGRAISHSGQVVFEQHEIHLAQPE